MGLSVSIGFQVKTGVNMIQLTCKLPSTQNTQLPMVLTMRTQETEEKKLSYFSPQLEGGKEGERDREREGTGEIKQLILDTRKQSSIMVTIPWNSSGDTRAGSYHTKVTGIDSCKYFSVSFVPVPSLFAGSAAVKSYHCVWKNA